MKFTKIFAVALGVIGLAVPVMAQQINDTFYPTRTYIWAPTVEAAGTSTTNAVDCVNLTGRSVMYVCATTNGSTTGTITVTPISSVDNTNWTTILNYAVLSQASYNTTNYTYLSGTNAVTGLVIVTNTVFAPGTLTTPVASSALFAGIPYFLPAQFTNTGATTLTLNKWYALVFNVSDANRYISPLVAPSATSGTNLMFSAILNGSVKYGGLY